MATKNKIKVKKPVEKIAYPGSILQNNYGESIDKGYVVWDVDKKEHERRIIPNDRGFAKIHISRGENVEERIDNIKFSNDKRKTKVWIVIEDFQENHSIEREEQVRDLVKQKHGCEHVTVETKYIEKNRSLEDNGEDQKEDSIDDKSFITLLKEFIEKNDFDVDEDLKKEIIDFAEETDKELEIDEGQKQYNKIEFESMEVNNIFSFPERPTVFNFDKLIGITGIFGVNYSGKTNFIKSLVWGLYQVVIHQGNPQKVVNIYTNSNTGYVKFYLKINDEKFFIKRSVTTKEKKDGSLKNSYEHICKKFIKTTDENGSEVEKWVSEGSDNSTSDEKEIQRLIKRSIGTFEDFTKICLQVQGGENDYLNQSQQPKNNLINRFLGLVNYKIREDYVKNFYNDVKRKQKNIGDKKEIENNVEEIKKELEQKNQRINKLEQEKNDIQSKKEKLDNRINELSKSIHEIKEMPFSSKEEIDQKISEIDQKIKEKTKRYNELEDWLKNNHQKEVPFDENETVESLDNFIDQKRKEFKQYKKEYEQIENWLNNNTKKEEYNVEQIQQNIYNIQNEIAELQNKKELYKGKVCPTCGSTERQPDPEREKECDDLIAQKNSILNTEKGKLNESQNIISHNRSIDNNKERLKNLKNTLVNLKDDLDKTKKKREELISYQEIIEHNKEVQKNNELFQNILQELNTEKENKKYYEQILGEFDENERKRKENQDIENKIEEEKENSKMYQSNILSFNEEINGLHTDVGGLKNNLQAYEDKLKQIENDERLYKKYSIYMQAVHRDGIPSEIIKRKLPLINRKINSILNEVCEFNMDLKITEKGDVIEEFYYDKQNKTDALPISSASGSQRFIISVAIKDALHHNSHLIKPSISIIDEGFGSLDNTKVIDIMDILYYLKSRYKNVIIITHVDQLQDFVDNIISFNRNRENVPEKVKEANPHASLTSVTVQN